MSMIFYVSEEASMGTWVGRQVMESVAIKLCFIHVSSGSDSAWVINLWDDPTWFELKNVKVQSWNYVYGRQKYLKILCNTP